MAEVEKVPQDRLPARLFTPGGDWDSRARKRNLSQDGTLERMFCLSCGRPSGWVSADVGVNMAIYICNLCTATSGGPLPIPRLDLPDPPITT